MLLALLLGMSACTPAHDDYLIAYQEEDDPANFGSVGYKNPKGEIVIPAKFHGTDTNIFRKTAFVVTDAGWACIDRRENVLLRPFIYDNGPDYLEEGLFRFVENGKTGFADADCVKLIPARFDFVSPFKEGLAQYFVGGKWVDADGSGEHLTWRLESYKGYVNKSGRLFSRVAAPRNGTREAWTMDNERVLLDSAGEVVSGGF
jgi:hypothetical protein